VTDALWGPLRFVPVYKTLVWGGRRMAAFRADLPQGPIGESWDLADHADGMSVVAEGPHKGRTLAALVAEAGREIVGAGFPGGTFPLMVKLIDAAQVLSVQVHPDDRLARELGVGQNGKTECWRSLADGGVIYQGTRSGIDRAGFERALAEGRVADTLNRYEARAGDFFFLAARTVHALGAGCLVYEVQQTSNVTFRVDDWGRVGLDGKPRPLHVKESLATIDFSRTGFGPTRPEFALDARGGETRLLVEGEYFRLEERRGRHLEAPAAQRCAIVIALEGAADVSAAGATLRIGAMQTLLVPAAAGGFRADAVGEGPVTVLVAEPRFEALA
jgi:mannose-6-phosphate isomerase